MQNNPQAIEVARIAENLLSEINQRVKIGKHNLNPTSSLGIAFYPKDGKKIEELLRNADTAMYAAKANGGNNFVFYSQKMNEESLIRLELETELREAIKKNELFLCFQPELDVKQDKIVAVEALVRWHHPTKGVILPLTFIPLAEETGLIIPLGEWVLRMACKQNKAWQEAGLPPVRVAVNITNLQIRQLDFVKKVKQILKETKLDPKYLELELSENSIINDIESINTFYQLKKLGVSLAIDDFGTGYSSLSYLRKMPLNRLKIDRSFVQNIQTSRGDQVLIRAIITMAQNLNMEILAEGVETQNQLDFLTSQNCTEIQGYYFSHPLLAEELADLLKSPHNLKQLLLKEQIDER